jgi:hypothetical protein
LRAEEDSSSGYALYLGINCSFEYKKFKAGNFKDELGIAHIAGPVADTFVRVKPAQLQIRMRMAVFGDFACVQSYGLALYMADSNSSGDLQDRGAYVTAEHGYYYAKGLTTDALLIVQWKKLEIGSRYIYHYFKSFNATQDRYQKSGNPIRMKDYRSELKSWMSFNFPDTLEAVKFEYVRKCLEGYADRYSRSTAENCFYGSFQYGIK